MNSSTSVGPFLMLHLGKTGGSAFKTGYLVNCFEPSNLVMTANEPGAAEAIEQLESMTLTGRMRLKFVVGHYLKDILHLIPKPHRYMTILRNPVDRVISHYYHDKYHHHMQGSTRNTQIWQENLSLLDAAERFEYFNFQSHQILEFLGRDKSESASGTAELALDAFEIVGITEKLQPLAYYMHKRFKFPLKHVYYRNTRQELIDQFIPDHLKSEILARSNQDAHLYKVATERFDNLFENVLSDEPDEDVEWNEFRSGIDDLLKRRFDEKLETFEQYQEVINQFEGMKSKLVEAIAFANAAIQQTAEQKTEIERLQKCLAERDNGQ